MNPPTPSDDAAGPTPAPRHRRPVRTTSRLASPIRIAVTGLVILTLVTLIGLRLNSFEQQKTERVAQAGLVKAAAAAGVSNAATPAATPTPAPTPVPTATPNLKTASDAALETATSALTTLMAGHPGIDVSISALNVTTGATFNFGSSKGMVEGSIVKLDILLSGLVKGNGTLTAAQKSYAVPMITQSDNGKADNLFRSIGGNKTMNAANQRFGLTSTSLNASGEWGLSTTSAADQVALLHQLVTPAVLPASAQSYALGLMSKVEADQRWGIGAAADAGTSFVNKNGWLNVDSDKGLWLTNSDGIVTVGGQKILLSVLTQHNKSFAAGVSLVEALAKAAAPSVTATT